MSEVHSYGRNKFGMLGTGDTVGRLWPRRINFAGVTELTRVVHVACSWFHSMALTDVGLLYRYVLYQREKEEEEEEKKKKKKREKEEERE